MISLSCGISFGPKSPFFVAPPVAERDQSNRDEPKAFLPYQNRLKALAGYF
jgi:hypothetical protein